MVRASISNPRDDAAATLKRTRIGILPKAWRNSVRG
jgi:hypothetical protein